MKRIQGIALFASAVVLQVSFATAGGRPLTVADIDYYGHIDVDKAERPKVIYAKPVVVERVYIVKEPVYLRVPPGHEKNWHKHCGEYNACGRRVYFVEDRWYTQVYVPSRKGHGHAKGKHK